MGGGGEGNRPCLTLIAALIVWVTSLMVGIAAFEMMDSYVSRIAEAIYLVVMLLLLIPIIIEGCPS